MAEIQIKLELQNDKGNIIKRVTIGVPDNITKAQLLAGVKSNFGDLFGSDELEIYIDLPDDRPLFGKAIIEGVRVIVRPKSSASFFRIIKEDN